MIDNYSLTNRNQFFEFYAEYNETLSKIRTQGQICKLVSFLIFKKVFEASLPPPPSKSRKFYLI